MAREQLSGYCPNCPAYVTIGANEEIECPNGCGSIINAGNLRQNSANNAAQEAAAIPVAMLGFENAESALVYIENFYENYCWEDFAKNADLIPHGVKDLIEKVKIKNGASGFAWALAFKGEGYPIFKKLEGLKNLEKEMAAKYNPKNNDAVLALFDAYRRVAKLLCDKKETIIKKLESYVRYAEKFALNADDLAAIKAELANITAELNAVKPVEKLLELPVYVEAKKAADQKSATAFFARGIDAETVYKRALARMADDNAPKAKIVEDLESIRGYSDAADYIKKLNKYYNFHGEFFDYMGKKFIFKEEKNVLDVSFSKKGGCIGKKKRQEEEAAAKAEAIATAKLCLSLYAFDEKGRPEKKPLIKGINQIIDCYGGRIYFYQNRVGIAYYDFISGAAEIVDKGSDSDYLNSKGEYNFYFNVDRNGFCFKKRLEYKNEKVGCLKKKTKNVPHENNYSLLFVDMRDNTVKTFIDECVDISDYYENSLFYTKATVIYPEKKKGCLAMIGRLINNIKKLFGKGKPEEYKVESSLHVCDCTTGENKKLLDEGCQIYNVVDGKIIYSVFAPNWFNLDMHVYNIATEEVTVIEKNVYDYFYTADGYIYYTVGNRSYQPLVRNNFEGTDRLEVMRNVTGIIGQSGGWLYIKVGKGKNAILKKVSVTGEEKPVLVCSQFKKIIYRNDTLIYYINTAGALCSVRTDGKEQKVINDNFDTIVAIGTKNIYFTVEEQVDRKRWAYSMYSIDVDGANTKKLVFDVTKTSNYDEDYFYYSKTETVRYKVTVPVSNKKSETNHAYFTTTEYYKYNKNTGTAELVLTLGLPDDSTEYKTGCIFKKKVEGKILFEKDPEPIVWKRTDLEEAGDVNDVQAAEEAADNAAAAAKANSKKNAKKSPIAPVFKIVGAVFAILAAIPVVGKLFKPFANKKK